MRLRLACVASDARSRRFLLLGVGASGFSVVHICGAVAAGMRVRAVSHFALGEENAHTAAASANAIATVARGRRGARSRALAFSQRAVLAAKYGTAWVS